MAKKLPKIRMDPRDELIIRKADLVPTEGGTWYRYKDLPSLRAFGANLIIDDDVDVPVTFQARWPMQINTLRYGGRSTLRFNNLRVSRVDVTAAELYCNSIVAAAMTGHWLTATRCNIDKLQITHCLIVRKQLSCDTLTFGPPMQDEVHRSMHLAGFASVRSLMAVGAQFFFEELEIKERAEIHMSRDRTHCIKGSKLSGAGTVTLFARDADIDTIDLAGKLYFGNTPLTSTSVYVYGGILGGMLNVLGDCQTDGELFVTQDVRARNLTVGDVLEAGWSIICDGDVTCDSEIRVGTAIRTGEINGHPMRLECNKLVRGTVRMPLIIERSAHPAVTTANRVLRLPTAQEKPPVE